MKPPNSTLNRGTSQLSRAKAGNLKRSNIKRTPMKKKKSPHDWATILDYVKERAKNRCERCGTTISSPSPQNCHHIKPRSAGGSDEPENVAFLCAPLQYFGKEDHSCHTWCHAHPKEARTAGWNK